jgi:CBS domain-containing protein
VSETAPEGDARLQERARFLARLEPFRGLDEDELARLAASITERCLGAGEAVLVESGEPGSELYVVRDGTLELVHKDVVVAMITSGDVFGHPTLLTGLAPEFTTRARSEAHLYCIPKDVALGILCHPEGVRFVARTLRDRLIQAARTMRALPDVRTRPVTSLLRSAPLFCQPDTSIREAAKLLIDAGRSALLVRGRDGLGIVTDVDLRDKVVVGGVSPDAPVSTIMTTPVKTLAADLLAPEASIEMMAAGVNHLPVVDAGGEVVGILSASNLMTLDARSPFALRRNIAGARTEDDVVAAAQDIPHLFVDLMEAHLDAPAVSRVLTLLHDAATMRLLELAEEQLGPPSAPYAWLAFGSCARSEMNLASDQDNGLAHADTDDPDVAEYFRMLALFVNRGLRRCGYKLDPHGVLAGNRDWRLTLSGWVDVFWTCLLGKDLERLARASVAFDFRQVAGELDATAPLEDIIRQAPDFKAFMGGLAQLGTQNPIPLGFRQRLYNLVDIKRDAIVPLQSLARYYAFSRGILAPTTLERLAAVRAVRLIDAEKERTLREAFTSMTHLQLRHHAFAIRNGKPLDNIIDVSTLPPITRASLQEAIREVAATQHRFPRLGLPGLG